MDDFTIAAQKTPSAWLAMHHIYGDLATELRFVTAFETWLNAFYKNGVEATIGRYINAK